MSPSAILDIPQTLMDTVADPSLDPLDRVKASAELRLVLRAFQGALVVDLKASGATWQEIGAALGITQQAAYQRYS